MYTILVILLYTKMLLPGKKPEKESYTYLLPEKEEKTPEKEENVPENEDEKPENENVPEKEDEKAWKWK